MQLLCQYERKSVLKFLETSESYRVEHCLRLCQEYRITDAAAFLLERVGDVGSALLLVLSDLNDKMIVLNAAIEDGLSGASLDHLNAVLKRKEVCSTAMLSLNFPSLAIQFPSLINFNVCN